MKKSAYIVFAILGVILLLYIYSNSASAPKEVSLHPMNEGDVFIAGGYVDIGAIRITYNGKDFEISNQSDKTIVATCQVVGVKADGTYEPLYWPAFGGVETAQRDADLKEKDWAINHMTNRVKPGETLTATLSIYQMRDFPNPDIDEDGYYDIMFVLYPQESEDVTTLAEEVDSALYKLKAD